VIIVVGIIKSKLCYFRTWSDREIRTLLTRLYDIPLNYARVVKFENDIVNCSKDLSEELSDINIPTPPYERYQDSKLVIYSLVQKLQFVACLEFSIQITLS
jgi:hypothetical protein